MADKKQAKKRDALDYADGSRKFKLVGGRHDGIYVRLYPEPPDGSDVGGWQRFVYSGDVYEPNGKIIKSYAEMACVGQVQAAA